MREIIFFGRGGQGGVTAANILVLAAAKQGLYGQAFPFFGAERRGAPIKAFARVSDKPIRRHGMFSDTDILLVLDPSIIDIGLAKTVKVRNGGCIIVNSPGERVSRDKFCIQGKARVYVIDATSIAVRNNLVVAGWPVINTAMLGALAKAMGEVSINSISAAIREYFGGEAGELNAKASEEAFRETRFLGEI